MRGTRRQVRLCGLALLLAGLLGGPHQASASAPEANADARFKQSFGDTFLEAYWRLNTDLAVDLGYYQVAPVLIVPDARSRTVYLRFLDRWIARLHAFHPAALDDADRTDYAVLDNQLASERWGLLSLREWQWNPATYNVADPFAKLLDTGYAPLEQRLRSVLKRLQNVPAYYQAAERSIRNPTREHTQLAIQQNQGALDVLGADLDQQVAASGLSAAERALFAARLAAARGAIRGYIDWLKALDARLASHGARSFRIGAALYEQKFAYDNPGSDGARALYQRALGEKESVLAQMDGLADQLWPRLLAGTPKPADRLDKIVRVVDQVARQHAAPDAYVPALKVLLGQLSAWVADHHLVQLDPSRPMEIREMPAYERGISIGNAESPGPYDPTASAYFNVVPPDSYPPDQQESLLREYNSWTTQVFVIHEAMPGHLVQFQHSNKSPSRIKAVFDNGSMVEGWAVYCERMMLESGWGQNAPELWLMYWKWYLRSVLNTILDYGVHAQAMSEADVKAMIMREGFQSQKEADIKWRRVQLSSVQLTRYFSGFSQIYGFREQLRQRQGAAFDLGRFHEQFLSYGSAPIGVIEQMMVQPGAPAAAAGAH